MLTKKVYAILKAKHDKYHFAVNEAEICVIVKTIEGRTLTSTEAYKLFCDVSDLQNEEIEEYS